MEEVTAILWNIGKAGLTGGILCALVQLLMDKTKLMPGRIMVLLVCSGCILGAMGIYGPFSRWAGAGANVPLPGFGNLLWMGVREAVGKEGLLGVFKGGLTNASGGIGAALVFSYLAALVFDPKMKK